MSTLTCVFGDGSTVQCVSQKLLSCSPVVASMMAETDEKVVPLPLIPSKDRFAKMMKRSKRMDTVNLVNVANDANYIGHTEALDDCIARLVRVVETGRQTEIHHIVDHLVPDVLNSVLREVHICSFFVNVGKRKMDATSQLRYVVEEAGHFFSCDFPISEDVLGGIERFDKFDLSKPEADEPVLKYLVCCIRDRNLDVVKEHATFISENPLRIVWVGEAASWFGCLDVVKLCLDMGRYGFDGMFTRLAIQKEHMDVIDYLVTDDESSLLSSIEYSYICGKMRLFDQLVQRWKDLDLPTEIECEDARDGLFKRLKERGFTRCKEHRIFIQGSRFYMRPRTWRSTPEGL